MNAIEVKQLKKSHGSLVIVNGISFQVKKGEIFGLLGPNGAGKTSTLEMIEGISKIDEGDIFINGFNLQKDYSKIKEFIGVQLQSTSIYNRIKVKEAFELFANYYSKSLNIKEVLQLFSLTEKANIFFKNLSAGQKQKVALGIAIINDPEILFLDEPTVGLDPYARKKLWNFIINFKAKGRTIIISTHYMEEAHYLCDRLAIMDKGKIIDLDSPKKLIEKSNLHSKIHIITKNKIPLTQLKNLSNLINIKIINKEIILLSSKPLKTLTELIQISNTKNFKIEKLNIKEPTLEDLFLKLTGKTLNE